MTKMDANLREYIPYILGGTETNTVVDNETRLEDDKAQGALIERALEELPEDVDARLKVIKDEEFLIDCDLNGINEVEHAYSSWMKDYDQASEMLYGEFKESVFGKDFEIRLEEIESVTVRRFIGPRAQDQFDQVDQYPSHFGSTGDYVKDIETGDTLAVLKGNY